jgi:hypothetical protein
MLFLPVNSDREYLFDDVPITITADAYRAYGASITDMAHPQDLVKESLVIKATVHLVWIVFGSFLSYRIGSFVVFVIANDTFAGEDVIF